MKNLSNFIKLVFLAIIALILFLIGCKETDTTSSSGDKGVLSYNVTTAFDIKGTDLRDVPLATNSPIHFSVSHPQSYDINNLHHAVDPSETATITLDKGSEFTVKATKAGTYKINSSYNGKVVDSITLRFDDTETIEFTAFIRTPYSEDFSKIYAEGQKIAVFEGSQLVVIAYPKNKDGEKMIAQMELDIVADPKWMVAPHYSDITLDEDDTDDGWADTVETTKQPTFYFIEPGEMTMTFTDKNTKKSSEYRFSVLPVDKEGIGD